ncbi:MAG: hypothetical protein L6V95_13795 [Candidatus Melainabacteria bacterium]|nr:MAG: hypothetical protein L6V95_13795 [Candidatus Melainabacteria bacterium]
MKEFFNSIDNDEQNNSFNKDVFCKKLYSIFDKYNVKNMRLRNSLIKEIEILPIKKKKYN